MKSKYKTLLILLILFFLPYVSAQTVSISGSVLLDNINERVPLVQVDLIDANSFTILDSVFADDFGNYHFQNVDTQGGTLDIFLNVISDSSFADIAYNLFQASYNHQSSVYSNINSNTAINISINTNNNTEEAFKVHNHLYKVFVYYRDILEFTPSGEVNVFFPTTSSTGYSNIGNLIHLEQGDTEYKKVVHEYGHLIIDKLYVTDPANEADCERVQTNPFTETGCKELAFEEGYADYHISPPNNTDMGPSTYTQGLENTVFNLAHNTAMGHKFHGEISGIFWDIADAPNSSDGSVGVDDDKIFNKDHMLWNVLYEYSQSEKPTDILEFYDRWINKKDYVEYKNLQNELYDIYYENNIISGTNDERISNDWAFFLEISLNSYSLNVYNKVVEYL